MKTVSKFKLIAVFGLSLTLFSNDSCNSSDDDSLGFSSSEISEQLCSLDELKDNSINPLNLYSWIGSLARKNHMKTDKVGNCGSGISCYYNLKGIGGHLIDGETYYTFAYLSPSEHRMSIHVYDCNGTYITKYIPYVNTGVFEVYGGDQSSLTAAQQVHNHFIEEISKNEDPYFGYFEAWKAY